MRHTYMRVSPIKPSRHAAPGKFLWKKKSRISCGNYIVQFSSKSKGLGRSSWLQFVLPNDVCSSQSSILKVKLNFFLYVLDLLELVLICVRGLQQKRAGLLMLDIGNKPLK